MLGWRSAYNVARAATSPSAATAMATGPRILTRSAASVSQGRQFSHADACSARRAAIERGADAAIRERSARATVHRQRVMNLSPSHQRREPLGARANRTQAAIARTNAHSAATRSQKWNGCLVYGIGYTIGAQATSFPGCPLTCAQYRPAEASGCPWVALGQAHVTRRLCAATSRDLVFHRRDLWRKEYSMYQRPLAKAVIEYGIHVFLRTLLDIRKVVCYAHLIAYPSR
jgi:hypothetical protein